MTLPPLLPPVGCSVIPDWHAREGWFSSLFPRRFPDVWAAVSAALTCHNIPFHLLPGTRDVWVRDFLPVPVSPERMVKFRYAPDYLRGFSHLRTGAAVTARLPHSDRVVTSDLILDGGNVVASTRRVILTDKVFRENPRVAPAVLLERLKGLFAGAEVLIVPTEPEDLVGHADGVVRFVNDETVVMNDYARLDPSYGHMVEAILKRAGLQVERMPCTVDTSPAHEDNLPSAVGNYVNFLRLGELILLPHYRSPEDREARSVLCRLLPQAEVVPILCTELAREGGVLNCASWSTGDAG